MIALLAIAPDGSGYSAYLETLDIHEARRERRRLERLGYKHFQLVIMPIQGTPPQRSPLVEG
jgi:hypothetical protein